MSYFQGKCHAVVLLCCVALLRRTVATEAFSVHPTVPSLKESLLSSNTALRAQSDKESRPSLQELIDETIESNRKLVSALCFEFTTPETVDFVVTESNNKDFTHQGVTRWIFLSFVDALKITN